MKTIIKIILLTFFCVNISAQKQYVREGRYTLDTVNELLLLDDRYINLQETGINAVYYIVLDEITSGDDCAFTVGTLISGGTNAEIDAINEEGNIARYIMSEMDTTRAGIPRVVLQSNQFQVWKPYIYIEPESCEGSIFYKFELNKR